MDDSLTTRRGFLTGLAGIVATACFNPTEAFAAGQEKRKPRSKTKKNKYATSDPRKDPEVVILARMIFGEARESRITDLERYAIGYTAINRANDKKKRFGGDTLHEVILAPKQYSCFNPNDPNRRKVLDPEKYEPKMFYHCLKIAEDIVEKKRKDPAGANHYHESSMSKPASWPDTVKSIGRLAVGKTKDGKTIHSAHTFYIG